MMHETVYNLGVLRRRYKAKCPKQPKIAFSKTSNAIEMK